MDTVPSITTSHVFRAAIHRKAYKRDRYKLDLLQAATSEIDQESILMGQRHIGHTHTHLIVVALVGISDIWTGASS